MKDIKFKFLMENGEITAPYYLIELIDSDAYVNMECEYDSKIKQELQYTGRKDKNDIEIYNGDIVSLFTESEHLEEEDWNIYKGEVKMLEGQWVIFDDKTNQPLFGFEDVEILGNRHENPELLEKNVEVDEV